MIFEECFGQFFMICVYFNFGIDYEVVVEWLVSNYYVGGICFFQGIFVVQVSLINCYQEKVCIFMMIVIDGEWGLNMCMKIVMLFLCQLMLGVICNNDFIYEMGQEVVWQMKCVGVYVNFVLVVDVNNNLNNFVIGICFFGEDCVNVVFKGV